MHQRISPASYGGLDSTALSQRCWHPFDGAATSDGSHSYQPVEHTSARAIIGAGGQHLPQCTQRPVRTHAAEPMSGPRDRDARPPSELREHASTDGHAREADGSTTDEARLLEGRVAVLVRLLDDDGHPVTSREEAAEHELLAEWERLGRLCICRGALPSIPRWLPPSMAPEVIAGMEARCPGLSTLHLVCVEFADGFLTVLEREELSFLPL